MFRGFSKRSKIFDFVTYIRVRPNAFNQIVVSDFDPTNDDANEKGNSEGSSKSVHVYMDPKIVRSARQIMERKSIDEEDDGKIEQVNQRIAEMETMLKIIVNKLNEIKRNDGS